MRGGIVTPDDMPEGTAVRVIDAAGVEWQRIQWVDTSNGQALQLVQENNAFVMEDFRDEDGKLRTRLKSRLVRLAMPVRFEWLGGPNDGTEWKPGVGSDPAAG